MHQQDGLTDTEIEIAKLLLVGLSNKEMATERRCSARTIQTHLHNIYSKLGVENRTEATILLLDVVVLLEDAKAEVLRRGETRAME